jgi:hypothetical protein
MDDQACAMDGASPKQQQQPEHHAPLKVASDHTIAMEAAGRPMLLQRNDTLCIDKVCGGVGAGVWGKGVTYGLRGWWFDRLAGEPQGVRAAPTLLKRGVVPSQLLPLCFLLMPTSLLDKHTARLHASY